MPNDRPAEPSVGVHFGFCTRYEDVSLCSSPTSTVALENERGRSPTHLIDEGPERAELLLPAHDLQRHCPRTMVTEAIRKATSTSPNDGAFASERRRVTEAL